MAVEGGGPALHLLSYLRTNCSGTFEVRNNSLANATVQFRQEGSPAESLETKGGAVLEMAG